ncbi:glycosyltransferase family 2 protein [Chitinophaga japonensis]|uniref:Glycosyltransferase involved in cell wall biosynthesis n=1 Tax=Chitinophaga japonensis TaxID=104662 RepID=A0A562TEU7_CHIJA|nr:glycosyltransferase family 2 protein [Chitinophaga japonensis]TWI92061.1 glycosyltransferase involved in cell wall biosynthesis [Chitinophaga japonensis]
MSSANKMVSIITPVYNGEKYIGRTIQSVVNQTYSDWELIIIDDCSTDATSKLVHEASEADRRIKLIKLKVNQGAAAARNAGIKASGGRFIAFLDGDDVWLPGKLETQLDFMLTNEVSFTYSAYYAVKDEIKILRKAPLKITYSATLLNPRIGCLTVIYDTAVLGKVYMPNIRKRQDWATWLSILKAIKETKGITFPLAEYTVRDNSLSSNKFKLIKYNWEVLRLHKPNILPALLYFSCFLVLNTYKAVRERQKFYSLKRKSERLEKY